MSPPQLALLAALFVVPVLASAEDAEPDWTELSLEQLLATKIVTQKFGQSARNIPSSVSILTAEDIRRFGWRTLADALRSLPGFNVTYDRTYAYAGLRGISAPGDFRPRLQVLVDGLSTTENIFDSALVGTDFPVDLDLVERIEVVRGPSASAFGANAMLGVINVITRQGLGGRTLEVSADAGSGRAGALRATAAGTSENGLQVLLSASTADSRGRRVRVPEMADIGLPPFTDGTDGDRSHKLFFRIGRDNWRGTVIHSLRSKHSPMAAYGTVFDDPAYRVDDGLTLAEFAHEQPLGSAGSLHSRIFAGQYRYKGDYPYDYPPYAINRDTADGRWWGFEGRWQSQPTAAQRLNVGLEFQRDSRQSQRNEDVGIGCAGVGPAPCLDINHAQNRLGIYMQDDITLRPDLILTLGLRHDRTSGFSGIWSPRLGLVYHHAATGTFKLLYASAYRHPSVYDRYYSAAFGISGGPDLKTERMRSLEGTWEKQLAPNARLTATAYAMRAADMVSGEDAPVAVNSPPLAAKGLELEYDKRWDGGATLRTGYTGQRPSRNGEQPDNAPRHMFKLNVALPLGVPGWLVAMETQSVAARRSAAGTATVGGHTVANLNLSYRPTSRAWEAGLGIYNLFDRHYADPMLVTSGVPVVVSQVIQDRQTLRLHLTARY